MWSTREQLAVAVVLSPPLALSKLRRSPRARVARCCRASASEETAFASTALIEDEARIEAFTDALHLQGRAFARLGDVSAKAGRIRAIP